MIVRPHIKPLHMKQETVTDVGTCKNCKYQGTGSEKCKTCSRSSSVKFWKKVKNPIDRFTLV